MCAFCHEKKLLFRVQAYIRNGWSNKVIDPDHKEQADDSTKTGLVCSQLPDAPTGVWQPIKDAFVGEAARQIFSFTNAQIINYFVVRTAVDGMPASDMKAINSSAMNLFRCGHVQDIRVNFDKYMCVQAKCLPEMRKDRIYKLLLFLDLESSDIVAAECGCPAGKGPCASCKHIGGLCYALEEFCRFGQVPEFRTCTDQLQQWNRPRPKKLDVIPVASLASRRHELLNKVVSKSASTFDPRQPDDCKLGSEALEKLHCDLLSLNQPCAFLNILVPSVEKIRHDHTYSKSLDEEVANVIAEPDEIPSLSHSQGRYTDLKSSLNVSLEERIRIERETRNQSSQHEWYILRSKRITGSKCGRILNQQQKTISLLKQCLYPKLLDPPPPPIAWGRHNESRAISKYVSYMTTKLDSAVSVEKCGFIIHPTKGWLGASPDGRVKDPTSGQCDGIIEVKCPYSKREMTPKEACADPNFCCKLIDSKVCLKTDHLYYHQVQLQLYVGSDLYDWCDFCIYTCRGLSVQRISPDLEWQRKCIPELESYFDYHIVPELVCPQYKPKYIL